MDWNTQHAVGVVSTFMGGPRRLHWEVVKWVLKYLKRTSWLGLSFTRTHSLRWKVSHTLNYYATSLVIIQSVTWYVFQVGRNTASWRSVLQHIVVLSTTARNTWFSRKLSVRIYDWKVRYSDLGIMHDDVKLFPHS